MDSTLYFIDLVDLHKSDEHQHKFFGYFLVTGVHKEHVIQVHPTVDSLWLPTSATLNHLSPIASVTTVIN